MNLRALALFREIFRSGSITGGATRLGVSQPSASRMLRHLEAQIGYPLFERTDGRIRPTHEAEVLIHDVDQIFLRVEQANAMARRLGRGGAERMAVVCVHMLATILPRVMRRLHRMFPELELELDTKGQAEQANTLLGRGADLGVATGAEPPPNLASKVFGHARLMAILPATHPLASREVVRLEDYAEHPCILSVDRDPLGSMMIGLFKQHGIRPNVKLTIGSPLFWYEAVRTFGLIGVAGPLTTTVMGQRPDVVIRPLEPAADYAVYALWNPAAAPSASRERLLLLLDDELKPLLNAPPLTTHSVTVASDAANPLTS